MMKMSDRDTDDTLFYTDSDSVEVSYENPGRLAEPKLKPTQEAVIWSDYTQYNVIGKNTFSPTTVTIPILPNAIFRISIKQGQVFFNKMDIVTDNLSILPDSSHQRILHIMEKFWNKKDKYKEHGLLHKRGILLHGSQGGGKTATINILANELLERDGIVIFCDYPQAALEGLRMIRNIEPNRSIILILEDIDEIINNSGEHDLLSLLDGENQIDNIVMIATTNFPERLGARIINRPSRFDEVIKIEMPSIEARRFYLNKVSNSALTRELINKWAEDTNGFSIAHLRELFIAVVCLEQDYDVTLKRIQTMGRMVVGDSGFNSNKRGFGAIGISSKV